MANWGAWYEESEHPRGPGGKWTDKGGSTPSHVKSRAGAPKPQAGLRGDASGLKNYLQQVATTFKNPVAQFHLDHGQEYKFDETSSFVKKGPQKQCYMNAGKLALDNPDLTYVEGHISLFGIPIEHAWTVDTSGKVIDPTLRPNKKNGFKDIVGYFGVPIKTSYLRKTILSNKMWGVLTWDKLPQVLKDNPADIVENLGIDKSKRPSVSDLELLDTWIGTDPKSRAFNKMVTDPTYVAAFQRLPVFEGTVYRGASFSGPKFKALKDSLQVGKTMTFDRLSSSSKDLDAAITFTVDTLVSETTDEPKRGYKPIVFKIEQRSGRDLRVLSNEKEVVLLPGSEFEVTAARDVTVKDDYGYSSEGDGTFTYREITLVEKEPDKSRMSISQSPTYQQVAKFRKEAAPLVKEIADREGFQGKITFAQEPGDGDHYTYAEYRRASDTIAFFDASATLPKKVLSGIAAHEIEHAKWAKVLTEWAHGKHKELDKYFVDPYIKIGADRFIEKMMKSGMKVSPYAKEYWVADTLKSLGQTKNMAPYAQAFNETLAEVARLRELGQTRSIAPEWNELYDTVDRLYKRGKR